MSRVCYAPFATVTFWSDRHVSPLLLSHPSKGCELICMTQHLSHTNKHRTNWLCCTTYQLPHQWKQPQRFLFVYSRTTRCVSSTKKNIVYYISVMGSLKWRTMYQKWMIMSNEMNNAGIFTKMMMIYVNRLSLFIVYIYFIASKLCYSLCHVFTLTLHF